jgi:transposase
VAEQLRAFAVISGTALIPAASGRTSHHRLNRLNRLGDRQLNCALHTIAITRMRCHPQTQAYVARRRAEGKTDREIRRCLKRYLARHLYRELTSRRPRPLDKTKERLNTFADPCPDTFAGHGPGVRAMMV